MAEFGKFYQLPGGRWVYDDASDALTYRPSKTYASDGVLSMASTTPTPENQPLTINNVFHEMDDLALSALQEPLSQSAQMRENFQEMLKLEKANYEAQKGSEATPEEIAAIRNNLLQQFAGEALVPPSSSERQRRPVHPMMALAQGDGEELTKDERKSFRNPRNINEIMESIAEYEPEFHQEFPLYKVEGTITDEKGRVIERTVINEANFLRWIRKRMRFFEGEDGPDTPVNYFSKLGVPFGTRHIHMSQFLEDDEKFFTDMDKAVHVELAQQIRRELFVRMIIRSRDISYRTGGKGMSDEGGIDGVMQSIFKDNNMTRNTWSGKSMWHWLLEMPYEVKTDKDPNAHHGHEKYIRQDTQDTRLGRGIATGIAAYYHLADYEKLQEMIGANSSLFTREGFIHARNALVSGENSANPFAGDPSLLANKYISDDTLNKIFRSDGKVNKTEFIKFVNFFPEATVDPRRQALVRKLIKEAIGHKYKLYLKDDHGKYKGEPELDKDGKVIQDEHGHPIPKRLANGKVAVPILDSESIDLAEEYAFLSARWTGIATRNDLGGTAYDAQAKWLRFKNYREKVADETRGGIFGNIYNVGLFKTLGVNYLDSIRNQDNKLVREIIEELATILPADVDEEKDEFTEEELAKLNEEISRSRRLLSELTFPDLSEVNYYNNGVYRWVQEYKSFISGDEPHFDKIVKAARAGGYLYNPAELGSKIQEGFIKPLRYGYSNWPNLYNKMVRDVVEYDPNIHGSKDDVATVEINKKDYIFTNMSLADSMFGNALIDRDIFWTRFDKDGNKIVDAKDESKVVTTVKHIVDPDRINADKVKLFKQMALGRVAADIYSHIDFNSPYEKWDGATIDAVINALAIIPGGVLSDENDPKNTLIPKYFFNDADIKWLRQIAHVSEPRRFAVDVGKDAVVGGAKVAKGFFKALWKGLK